MRPSGKGLFRSVIGHQTAFQRALVFLGMRVLTAACLTSFCLFSVGRVSSHRCTVFLVLICSSGVCDYEHLFICLFTISASSLRCRIRTSFFFSPQRSLTVFPRLPLKSLSNFSASVFQGSEIAHFYARVFTLFCPLLQQGRNKS